MYGWIFGCGILFAFYNAWGIGANDCANSFATSVGAKVLSLRSAVIIAGIFEFSGAVLMCSHVTDAIRKNIIEPDVFKKHPGALMYGMLCADLSSAIWLTIATYFKYPVSTTHSIIGAIVGFALAFGGNDVLDWEKIGFIIASWIISPLLAGVFSFVTFVGINKFVFNSVDPYNNTIKIFPLLTFVTFFVNSLFIIYKGSPQLKLDEMALWKCLLISFAISIITALLSFYIYVPYVKRKIKEENNVIAIENGNNDSNDANDANNANDSNNNIEETNLQIRTTSYRDAMVVLNNETLTQETNTDDVPPNTETKTENDDNTVEDNTVENNRQSPISLNFIYDNDKDITENIKMSKKHTLSLENINSENLIKELHNNAHDIDPDSDRLCSWIQIITACFSSFAHGSNDVANAIAPLATIYYIYKNDSFGDSLEVPVWVLLIGGLGIVLGLATWGYKIIDRIGKELTKITPSRGFIIELSAALTVIIASRAEIPVSTTHCQVGSVLGCGMGGGLNNIDWKLVKGILFSWLVTLPFTGILSAALFSYGYYSPNKLSDMKNNENSFNNYNNMSNFSGYEVDYGSGFEERLLF